ncbi:MAG: class I SAM-dependent methyltransferase [Proteobacteria bacterium]|nr:class I SAM-dependent methyltransferase [Pseudomonadota bacterium]
MPPCPVCEATEVHAFTRVGEQAYWRCGRCVATFLDAAHRLGTEAERAVYEEHDNTVADAGYRRFLSKLADPLLARVRASSTGLDFGCGPGPALAAMLREAGHTVAVFDPFFFPDATVLDQTYDFVTCTEVVEHLHQPGVVFDQLGTLLRTGGTLAVMTCFQTDDARFAGWNYRRDPTHVVFYREETMRFIASQRGWSIEIPRKDVALFTV